MAVLGAFWKYALASRLIEVGGHLSACVWGEVYQEVSMVETSKQ